MEVKHLSAIIFVIASIAVSSKPGFASDAGRVLVLVSGAYSQESVAGFVADLKAKKVDITKLPSDIEASARETISDINLGMIEEVGKNSPPHLNKFNEEIMAVAPEIFDFDKIYVITEVLLPIELVHKDGRFLGDHLSVSHYFGVPDRAPNVSATPRDLSSYVVEAVIPMGMGQRRIDQDIVRVALEQEKFFPVELDFGSGKDGLKRVFERHDIAILHIDTHGAGPAIQASRKGEMITGADIPQTLKIPLVLLFGCEGVANKEAFGSVMQARGVTTVISSFGKFTSFGITGDPKQEALVYETFFNAIRSGQAVGKALVQVREVARQAALDLGIQKTLTRQLFVLIGDDELRFQLE